MEHPIQSPPMAYLEPCHASKMEVLRKKLTAINIFAKNWMFDRGPSAKVCENLTFKQITRNSAKICQFLLK